MAVSFSTHLTRAPAARRLEAHARNGAPAVIIGLGEFGRQVLAALDLAAGTRPTLPKPAGVWAGPTGWSRDWTSEPPASDWPSHSEWWGAHGPSAGQRGEPVEPSGHALQAAILEAFGASGGDSPGRPHETLDLYLVAHLNEPFARDLWQPVLTAARASPILALGGNAVFTLILAIDSLALPLMSPDEAAALLAGLDRLADELVAATDERELPGRVGWCYLLDTLDTHGHPLRPLDPPPSTLHAPRLLQAHLAAEFIALLSAGLRHTPAYRRTSLAHVARDFRGRPPTAWVSTFGVGCLVLPVYAIAERARDRLAHRLLGEFILGRDAPGDPSAGSVRALPAARKLRSRWLAECTLNPSELRSRIARDPGGQPIAFPTEPPSLEGLPDDWLINHLQNWDAILWQRWNRPPSAGFVLRLSPKGSGQDAPPAQMARNADALRSEAGAWVKREVDGLLENQVGGARIGALFIAEAERALEAERQKPETPGDVGATRVVAPHWFAALLAPLRPSPPDPAALPDLEASRRKLEAALRRRLIPRAVWTRASLFAAVLLSFAWAAYLAAGRALGLGEASGLLSRWLGLGPLLAPASLAAALDLFFLFLFCWIVALLAGWFHLYRSEATIHRATDRMIADIRRKYAALMERALRAERERVYAGLRAELAEWEKAIGSRRAVLEETLAAIETDLNREVNPAPLLTEQSLLAPAGWRALFPETDSAAARVLAERFLNTPRPEDWRSETPSALAAALRQFAASQLSDRLAGLNLETWAAQPDRGQSHPLTGAGGLPGLPHRLTGAGGLPGQPHPLTGAGGLPLLVEHLRSQVRPALPLSREERAGLAARLRHPRPVAGRDSAPAPLVVNFLGLPARTRGETAPSPGARPEDEVFSTGEPGRLALVPTLHALEFGRLRVWDRLKVSTPPHPPTPSPDAERQERGQGVRHESRAPTSVRA